LGTNLFQLALIFQERLKAQRTTEDRILLEWLFPSLGNLDFRKLLAASQHSDVAKVAYLAMQGGKLEQLHVITQGVHCMNLLGAIWVSN
jgi:hypothetical protein